MKHEWKEEGKDKNEKTITFGSFITIYSGLY